MEGLNSYVNIPSIKLQDTNAALFLVDTRASSSDETDEPQWWLELRAVVIAADDHIRVIFVRTFRVGEKLTDTLDEWPISIWEKEGTLQDPDFAHSLEKEVGQEKRRMFDIFKQLLWDPPTD